MFLLTVVFNEGTTPAYLTDSLRLTTMVEGRRCLRCADTMELLVPVTRFKTLGDYAFSVVAARAWNALPSSVKLASSHMFRRRLKTELFCHSYPA